MSDDEDDPEEKLGDTVRYLQKLGPDHLDVILEASKWVFQQDKRAGLEVSCSPFQSPFTFPCRIRKGKMKPRFFHNRQHELT